MKLPFSLFGGITSLLLIGSLAGDVLANKLDKSAQAVRQKNRGRRALMRSLESRSNQHPSDRWDGKPPTGESASACEDTPPQEINAPKENVWYGLTDDETADVAKWLFGRPELNLTTSEIAGEWDNTM
jgi:primary-amine oxidase